MRNIQNHESLVALQFMQEKKCTSVQFPTKQFYTILRLVIVIDNVTAILSKSPHMVILQSELHIPIEHVHAQNIYPYALTNRKRITMQCIKASVEENWVFFLFEIVHLCEFFDFWLTKWHGCTSQLKLWCSCKNMYINTHNCKMLLSCIISSCQ